MPLMLDFYGAMTYICGGECAVSIVDCGETPLSLSPPIFRPTRAFRVRRPRGDVLTKKRIECCPQARRENSGKKISVCVFTAPTGASYPNLCVVDFLGMPRYCRRV